MTIAQAFDHLLYSPRAMHVLRDTDEVVCHTFNEKLSLLIVTMLDIDNGRPIEDAINDWPEDVQPTLRESLADVIANGNGRLSRRIDL